MKNPKCHDHVIGRAALLVGCTALVLSLSGTGAQAQARDVARQTLGANDGWGAYGTGTSGGAAADAAHVYTVTTWEQFKAALKDGGTAPRIIKVKGMIDAVSQGCEAFEAEGYDFQQYLADYDPAVWGHDKPVSGVQEDLRAASAAQQDKIIKASVPANTTIIGVGKNSGILGGSLQIKGVDNVIVRNLTIEAPVDCFPQWDPTDDNKTGAWNSEYDGVVVYGSTHVWIDHNTLTDGRYPDSSLPSYFGKTYQQHDGLADVVRGSNHVTVSWNSFKDHDKTMLIGNSDSATADDTGKLKVTLHHNRFEGIVERAPRVRFGQVDSYNNHFVVTKAQKWGYVYGIGKESRLVAEHNAFTLAQGISTGKILKKWNEAPVTAGSNYVNGKAVDLIAVHNAEIPGETLQSGAGWTPTLRAGVDPAKAVPGIVDAGAGAGRVC
ncbi:MULTISPECIES: polysaccharide lyase family 1 protein [Streptomyces]|uniref:Pectate lyase n=1 Tax=Streptomyces koelreuteriae TaxID=2838015 RepID=A0ABX8FYX7_9ACTN|nr:MULTISPECIES: pectate lyase [Streptomyces]QWB26428.1 pectate lyase [Streptomyces koelreuteriae]UUA09509.1 pectate lyase [Streptomyces koelreuteriae]UUA17113.1 pectate lyase [Streptomyces sp. CRCS-T-1]